MKPDEVLPQFRAQPGYEPYGRDQVSDPPGLDCLTDNHFWIENTEPGAWVTSDGLVPRANWCLWCGGGSTNEQLPDEEGRQ